MSTRAPRPLGAPGPLSSAESLSEDALVEAMAELRPPVFWGRDVADPIITSDAIERTQEWLPEHSTLTANLYPGIQHGVSQEEITDVAAFLRQHLFSPEAAADHADSVAAATLK